MDLLGAVSVLFGDCSMNPEDEIIFIKGVKATPEQLEKATIKATEVQAVYDSNQYQRDRAQEYPPIVDQLDDIFHNGLEGWKAQIQVVKDKYPKTETQLEL